MDSLQWFKNFLIKKASGSGIKNENKLDQQLAAKIRKPIIRKFQKRKIRSIFIDNFWGADLADMQLVSKFSKGIRYLWCVIDTFSKYAWVVPLKALKDKKDITITNAFQKKFIIILLLLLNFSFINTNVT